MSFSQIRERLFRMGDDEIIFEAYKEPNGELSIWLQVGIAAIKLNGISQAIDVIDLITDGLEKLGETDEFCV